MWPTLVFALVALTRLHNGVTSRCYLQSVNVAASNVSRIDAGVMKVKAWVESHGGRNVLTAWDYHWSLIVEQENLLDVLDRLQERSSNLRCPDNVHSHGAGAVLRVEEEGSREAAIRGLVILRTHSRDRHGSVGVEAVGCEACLQQIRVAVKRRGDI